MKKIALTAGFTVIGLILFAASHILFTFLFLLLVDLLLSIPVLNRLLASFLNGNFPDVEVLSAICTYVATTVVLGLFDRDDATHDSVRYAFMAVGGFFFVASLSYLVFNIVHGDPFLMSICAGVCSSAVFYKGFK